MSAVSTPIVNPIAANLYKNAALGATADADIRGGATTIFQVDIDNTANGAPTFVKVYDSASPTVGTTAPDYIFKVPAGVRRVFTLGLEGVALTNCSIAAVTAGGTAGTSNPASSCIVRALFA